MGVKSKRPVVCRDPFTSPASLPSSTFSNLRNFCRRRDQRRAGPSGIENGVGNNGWWLVSLLALLLAVARIGGVGAWLVGSSRVAFVVGLDRYFPEAFSRIHPRWHTPHVAIIVQGATAVVFLLLSVLGKGTTVETAFLILIDMSLLIYFVPYLYLFVCFVVHCWRRRDLPLIIPGGRFGAVIAGIFGSGITLFAMVVAMIPPPGTADIFLHEAKLGGGSLFLVAIGLLIYWRARPGRGERRQT